MYTEDSLSKALERAKSSTYDQFEIELSSSGKRSWILEIIVSHKVDLSRYVGGADFETLKEKIVESVGEFYESKKETIGSSFPIIELENILLERRLDQGTRLVLDGIEIKIQN